MKIFCRDCGVECKDKKRFCWIKFNMCVKCAVKKYPNEFPKNFQRRYNGTVKRIGVFKNCSECKQIMAKIQYMKNRVNIRCNIYLCYNCQILYVFDSKIRIARTLEVKL